LEDSGLDKEHVDMTRPMAVALSLVDQGGAVIPMPTFIIPVKDPQAALAAAAQSGSPGKRLLAGDYLGVSFDQAYQLGNTTPAIAKDLAAGHVCARFDIKGIVARYRPMIEKYMNPAVLQANPAFAANPQAVAYLGGVMDGLKAFLESLDTIEASVTLNGGAVDLRATMTMVEGSEFALPVKGGGFGDATKSLAAADADFVLLMRANWSAIMDLVEPMMEGMVGMAPPEQQQDWRTYMKKARELYDTMGDTLAYAGDFTDNGIAVSIFAEVDKPESYLARYRDLIESPAVKSFGMEMSSHDTETIDGVEMDRFSMKFDFAALMALSVGQDLPPEVADEAEEAQANMDRMMTAMFGPNGIQVRQGAVDDGIVMVMGGDQKYAARAVDAAKNKNGALPAAAQRALERAGDASFLLYVDFRNSASWVMDLARTVQPGMPMPPIADGPAVPFLITASSDGRKHVMNLHVDVAGIAGLFPKPPR
jgi:hypothetical protein